MTLMGSVIDGVFDAFGSSATYVPAGSDPLVVKIIAKRPDAIAGFGESRIHVETATFELRASEAANPRPDDQLIVDGQTFVV